MWPVVTASQFACLYDGTSCTMFSWTVACWMQTWVEIYTGIWFMMVNHQRQNQIQLCILAVLRWELSSARYHLQNLSFWSTTGFCLGHTNAAHLSPITFLSFQLAAWCWNSFILTEMDFKRLKKFCSFLSCATSQYCILIFNDLNDLSIICVRIWGTSLTSTSSSL